MWNNPYQQGATMRFARLRDSRIHSQKSELLRKKGLVQTVTLILNFVLFFLLLMFAFRMMPTSERNLDKIALGVLILLAGANQTFLLWVQRIYSQWAELEKTTFVDPITGVLNRLSFERLLDEELRRAGRYHYPLSICHLDIDDFRAYNESFGMDKGTQLLGNFGRFVSGNIRTTDCAARDENDSFFILLPHTDIVRAQKFLARLQTQATEGLDSGFSAGVTSFQVGESRTALLRRATLALEQAKREGKKQIRGFVSGLDSNVVLSF